MKQLQITLQDGSQREVAIGSTLAQIAQSLGSSIAKQAVAGEVNGKQVDLNHELQEDAAIRIILQDSPEGLHIYRHTAAHVMAQAIRRLYGEQAVKLGIGPVIEGGFYYDMDSPRSFSPEDLLAIEQEMHKIASENLPVLREEVTKEEAVALFEQQEEPFKLELIENLPEGSVISLYRQGEFVDLCRGPHLPSTGRLKHFKLMSVAGAYWRGDSDRQMLQRIYGTAFLQAAQLKEHLQLLEEAKRRDHRRLGKDLGLFLFSDEAAGMPFFLPKGLAIRLELEIFERSVQAQAGYSEVRTPLMMNSRIWEQSGHWEHYKDNMYFSQVDEAQFALKPMNCPGHMLIYKHALRSYRDLPLRLSEFGQVHRHEASGALSGMMRVRTFCQDDAHLFVTPQQIEPEIRNVFSLIDHVYKTLGFSYTVELSTKPEHAMGSAELWDEAERSLVSVLDGLGASYTVNEGDGAFYGPKIDFHIQDALKRSWQCGTIQLDFQMPEKFELSYVGEDGEKHRPIVIHRALYGSIERFIGILTEHFAGDFPLWLAPVHARLLPISEQEHAFAHQVKAQLEAEGLRVEIDARAEKLGYRMREAQLQKLPYTLVIGAREREAGCVSVRKRSAAGASPDPMSMTVAEIAEVIANQIRTKEL